jgi:hypothetical protein
MREDSCVGEALGDQEAKSDEVRRLATTTVAAGLIGWWPAFTLGAWGVVFFQQMLALWVAATSVFAVILLARPRELLRRPSWLVLLIPSIWVVGTLVGAGGSSALSGTLFWLGVVVTILGFPAMAALLVRIVVPDTERLRGRSAVIALSVVGVVMLGSFTLGRLHPRLLTCEDFAISGNSEPVGCAPGEGTTTRH